MPSIGGISLGLPLLRTTASDAVLNPTPPIPPNVLRDEDGNPMKDEDGNWILVE